MAVRLTPEKRKSLLEARKLLETATISGYVLRFVRAALGIPLGTYAALLGALPETVKAWEDSYGFPPPGLIQLLHAWVLGELGECATPATGQILRVSRG